MKKILSIMALAAFCGTARAVEYYWQGAVSGDLGDTNNFVLSGSFKTNVLPQAADNVNINSSLYPVTNLKRPFEYHSGIIIENSLNARCLQRKIVLIVGLFVVANYGSIMVK
jgi:hypothetical protein